MIKKFFKLLYKTIKYLIYSIPLMAAPDKIIMHELEKELEEADREEKDEKSKQEN